MILVTGADGMTGSYAEAVFPSEKLFLTGRKNCDITDSAAVARVFAEVKPSVVLHLAAATHVDRCETEKERAWETNVEGTRHIAEACRKSGAFLVYAGTSSVFNGRKEEPYTEEDTPDPVSVYAKSKWEGEKIVGSLGRYLIVRAAWMIGGKERDKKFVAKMVRQCRQGKDIEGVNDKIGTITYAEDFLKTVRLLLEAKATGICHVANRGVCTRFEIAKEIVRILKSPVKVTPVPSSRFPLPAPRGRSEAIASNRLEALGLPPLPTWQEALKNYLESWNNA